MAAGEDAAVVQAATPEVDQQAHRSAHHFEVVDHLGDFVVGQLPGQRLDFHYHPPLSGVVAHGSPCFWGWITMPEMQQAEQTVRFQANTATRTIPPGGGGGGYK